MQKFGLLGRKLSHSLSPLLHKLIYEKYGMDGVYNLFEVEPEHISEVVPALKTLGFRGMNVTIPYKRDIIPFLDSLSPEAQKLGAVNTVVLEPDGRTVGYNTDYYGFSMSLAHAGIKVEGKSFLLCGMSGAGRAVYEALADGGALVKVASTNPEKGIPYDDISKLGKMDVIVNCTPVGMYPNTGASVVDMSIFSQFKTAVDIVYNPAQTLFLRYAEQMGLDTVGGLYMLIYQGMKSVEFWTGIKPDMDFADIIFEKLKGAL